MNKTIPNLESIVSGLSNTEIIPNDQVEEKTEINDEQVPDTPSDLWNNVIELLKRPSESNSQKTYKIDEDIIETLSQCKFNAPTTSVINSILRVFIIAHLPHLRCIRQQKPISLFDKY